MLRTTGSSVSDDIDAMVEGLLREDRDYERTEHRAVNRQSLVLSVLITRGSSPEPIEAFSRNISRAGIGLITDELMPERSTATLTIQRLDGTSIKVLAECRWCKPYGKKWKISGWQFLNLR